MVTLVVRQHTCTIHDDDGDAMPVLSLATVGAVKSEISCIQQPGLPTIWPRSGLAATWPRPGPNCIRERARLGRGLFGAFHRTMFESWLALRLALR